MEEELIINNEKIITNDEIREKMDSLRKELLIFEEKLKKESILSKLESDNNQNEELPLNLEKDDIMFKEDLIDTSIDIIDEEKVENVDKSIIIEEFEDDVEESINEDINGDINKDIDEEEILDDTNEIKEEIYDEEALLNIDYNTYNNLEDLLIFDETQYKLLKHEINTFIAKLKGKKFTIRAIHYNMVDLAREYVYKIRPLLEFIVIRNRARVLAKKFARILDIIDKTNIGVYTDKLNEDIDYGKSMITSQLNYMLREYDRDLRKLILLLYSAQPIKGRNMSQQTVGVSFSEFNDLMEEGGDSEPDIS